MIETVKIQGQGYLLNGIMHVPKADGNREYEAIKVWLSEGNIPEPEFTEEELAQQSQDKQVQEAKQYHDTKMVYKILYRIFLFIHYY